MDVIQHAPASTFHAEPAAKPSIRRAKSRVTLLPQAIMSKVRVLFFAANPLSHEETLQRLQTEARKIEEELRAARPHDTVDFKPHFATRLKDLRRGLLLYKPNIVHVSGHGGAAGLMLEAEDGADPHPATPAALKEFFGVYRDQIRVVVLNAPHSRPQAEAIADTIGCAIGAPDGISPEAAITFSVSFYSSIAFGQSVQAAYKQARANLRMKGFADDQIPRLVMRPGLEASTIVLDDSAPAAPPIVGFLPHKPPVRPDWRVRRSAAAAAVVSCAAVTTFLLAQGPDACAPARAVQRDVLAASAPVQAQVRLISAPSAGPNDPMAGPGELVRAKALHAAGNHAADFALFRQAAMAGNAEAMTSLGLAYLRGEGTPVQADSGVHWLRRAAREDDLRGMTELGNAYYNRVGVDRDSDHLAKHWYQKAADRGYAEAMRNLGTLYREGRGVEKADGVAALEWYVKAARAGFVDAMVDAGTMYLEGLSVPRDERQAMCWYEAAADAGSKRGKGVLGIVDEKNLSKADDVGD